MIEQAPPARQPRSPNSPRERGDIFLVSRLPLTLPIPLEEGVALRDEDQTSLFLSWLGEHSSAVMKVARAYTLANDECQDLAQEILLQAWRSLPNFEGKASSAT